MLESLRHVATELITAFGKSVEVTIVGPAAYNPSTRSATRNETATTVQGVLGNYDARQIGGTVERNDFPLWIDAPSIDRPAPGDMVTVDGARMKVISVRTTYAGSLPALYELQVRQ